jgi:hypothetical protein
MDHTASAMGGVICYGFSSCWRSVGVGLGQFWHKNVRILDLNGRWNATSHPVLDALRATWAIQVNQFCDLGWATKTSNQSGIRVCFTHTRIKHHV